jgi:acetate kinase
MSILVFNAGSSSLKFGLFGDSSQESLASGYIDWANGDREHATLRFSAQNMKETRTEVAVPDDRAATCCAIDALRAARRNQPQPWTPVDVIGHRVVHCGAEFSESVLIDNKVKETITRWSRLAPLHNPPTMAAICAAETALPNVTQVAVFDTAFCARMPPRAYVYPVPYQWLADWGVRRFGFHGISHEYCSHRAADMLGRDLKQLRIVSCHLGGGCSAAAIQYGVPVASTTGFSPLEGLMMGTRPGSIDAGVVIYLEEYCGLSPEQIHDALTYHSGLLGVSGVSPDIAKIEVSAKQGNSRAQLALEIFADRVRSAIGALTVTMGGIDVLLFTDRVGEKSPGVRAMICERLECLGLRLDQDRNRECKPDCDVAAPESSARILVICTHEEWMIAREAHRVKEKMGRG